MTFSVLIFRDLVQNVCSCSGSHLPAVNPYARRCSGDDPGIWSGSCRGGSGWKLGLCSVLVYILIGAAGLPVFANFGGGIRSLIGLTGGYIWAWPVMAVLCGIRPGLKNRISDLAVRIFLSLIGLAAVELIGGLQWAALSGDMTAGAVFAYSMVAFVPKDIVITILGVIVSEPVKQMTDRIR